jgi:hypothetical protein
MLEGVAHRAVYFDESLAANKLDWSLVFAAHPHSWDSRARSSRERRRKSVVAQKRDRAFLAILKREGDSGSQLHTNTSALAVLAWYRRPEFGTSSCYGFVLKLDPLLK